MKHTILVLTFLFSFFIINSQTTLNNYKYIIVPDKFDFLDEADKYQLNSLTKFLFEKYGLKAFLKNEAYPEDLIKNNCLGLTADVLNNSGLFTTKLQVQLKDCKGQTIYTSAEGRSKEKEYKTAYNLALREAFESFKELHYNYQEPKPDAVTKTDETSKINILKNPEQAQENILNTVKENPETPSVSENTLYAQTTNNGYQLVDSTPKIVYYILKTGMDNVFLVAEKEALLYKKEKKWILEYYENGILKQDSLTIKF